MIWNYDHLRTIAADSAARLLRGMLTEFCPDPGRILSVEQDQREKKD